MFDEELDPTDANCGMMFDDLADYLEGTNTQSEKDRAIKMVQTSFMAIQSSCLQRIADALEKISTEGIPNGN